ncbi:hypothetical protein BC938DRAFT_481598 [Jimgerdemannia flammicorona]|uniref:Uncharacterized protein n=1 Tax=Jimgerdemannia flammicorona TaxID=994334 RepID=A0A433QWR7_9FUNG|nr:hypothetical protein BC938DRAFT_481598 [Jimgerdemannia flammicorona]
MYRAINRNQGPGRDTRSFITDIEVDQPCRLSFVRHERGPGRCGQRAKSAPRRPDAPRGRGGRGGRGGRDNAT